MRFANRAALRGPLAGLLGLAVLSLSPVLGLAGVAAEKALPESTIALIKTDDATKLRTALDSSQIGRLIADPAMKPLKDDIRAKLEDANNDFKAKLGVTISELLQIPQGAASVALIRVEEAMPPFALLISADAGAKQGTMQEVMDRATSLAQEDDKAKVTTETFKNLKLTVVRSTKEEDQNDPPLVWTKQGSVFHLASDVDVLKDLLSNADGREDSLAASESFVAVQKRVAQDAQLVWYLDIGQALKLVTQAAGEQGGNAGQIEAQLQLVGLNNLKAIGGGIAFGTGEFDHRSQVFVYSPGPSQGLFKLFAMPKANLKPQPWVPASVASYQSISWDLDAAYVALNDLADMFAPGALQNIETQIVGPDGQKISFEKDLFGPLGDRITIISDFKKPVTEKSQRNLLAIELEDPKTFQNSLNKIFEVLKANPKKREFQNTTIYEVDLPQVPNAGGAGLPATVSMAISRDTLFVASDPTLVEQVIRTGGPSLADSPAFQAVAKLYPAASSTLSYQKPEEQARLAYDMVKSGQLREAINKAVRNAPNGADLPDKNLIDPEKLPEFEVFAKYLSQGGGYGVMEEDGITFIQFTLKKTSP